MTLDTEPLVLRALTPRDEHVFLQAWRDWPSTEEMEFAPQYAAVSSFDSYVHALDAFAAGVDLPEGWVPSLTLFGFMGDAIVGRLQLRLRFNDFLWNVGGQVGYVVLPRFRRRGYARSMLRQGLERARAAGLRRVLITCDLTNSASRHLIETSGGIRIGSHRSEPSHKLRYWLTT